MSVPQPLKPIDWLLKKSVAGSPVDAVKTSGSALGGAVDLSWMTKQLLVLLTTERFNAIKFWKDDETFEIEEWATRKRSEGSGMLTVGLTTLLEAPAHAYLYPALGRAMYENRGFFWLIWTVKGLLNGAVLDSTISRIGGFK